MSLHKLADLRAALSPDRVRHFDEPVEVYRRGASSRGFGRPNGVALRRTSSRNLNIGSWAKADVRQCRVLVESGYWSVRRRSALQTCDEQVGRLRNPKCATVIREDPLNLHGQLSGCIWRFCGWQAGQIAE